MIDIIIPSYGRADRAMRVWANVSANTVVEHKVHFVVERFELGAYDEALQPAGRDVYVWQNTRSPNYAGAVNTAATLTDLPNLFLAADDLTFHRGWDTAVLKVMDAAEHIKVVGTNDLLNTYVLAGHHATHYLISRDYLEDPGGCIDGDPGHVLFEGYSHNYSDTEFIGTAKARAVFAPCLDSVVEHNHFTVGKSEKDDTYAKGYEKIDEDSRLYTSRQPLWWNIAL